MKFAMVNGARNEAKKGLSGLCPSCGNCVIPKCGEKKLHHWSHKGKLECDPWRENETEWHRTWKGHFPKECQEVVHRDELTGEKHIADVKTDTGTILEFQHSPIQTEERKSRNDFYKQIVWIVDGKRLQRDEAKFAVAYDSGLSLGLVKRVHANKSSLILEWSGMSVPAFFDFGQSVLWLLIPNISDATTAYIFPVSKTDFLEIFREGHPQKKELFWNFLNDIIMLIKNPQSPQMIRLPLPQRRIRRGPRIDYIQSRQHRKRRRF